MDKCLYCHGTLQEERVSRVQEYHGRWFLIENLPALVCSQCGETYYSPQAHDTVLALVRAGHAPIRIESLEVMDAAVAPS
jgi:YgiT-type zinc finger domain-containing protein